ncbi:MAG: hypothetical protein QXT19_01695 [Candidatus Woesearchaeota archaeon]
MALKDALLAMEQIGLTDVILPFILVFTVVFAVLQKSKVLGTDAKGKPKANYNAMVAFVLAFFVLVMMQTLKVVTWLVRYIALLLLAFVFLGILFSFLGLKGRYHTIFMYVSLVLLSFVFLKVLVMADVLYPDTAYRVILPLMIAVYIAIAIVYWVLEQKAEKPPKARQKPEEVPGIEKSKIIKGRTPLLEE